MIIIHEARENGIRIINNTVRIVIRGCPITPVIAVSDPVIPIVGQINRVSAENLYARTVESVVRAVVVDETVVADTEQVASIISGIEVYGFSIVILQKIVLDRCLETVVEINACGASLDGAVVNYIFIREGTSNSIPWITLDHTTIYYVPIGVIEVNSNLILLDLIVKDVVIEAPPIPPISIDVDTVGRLTFYRVPADRVVAGPVLQDDTMAVVGNNIVIYLVITTSIPQGDTVGIIHNSIVLDPITVAKRVKFYSVNVLIDIVSHYRTHNSIRPYPHTISTVGYGIIVYLDGIK